MKKIYKKSCNTHTYDPHPQSDIACYKTAYVHVEIGVTVRLIKFCQLFGHKSAPSSRIWTGLVPNEAEQAPGLFETAQDPK